MGDRYYPAVDHEGRLHYFPSVSTICSVEGKEWLDAWRQRVGPKEAERISRETRDTGSNVHALIKQVNTGGYIGLDEWNGLQEGERNGMRGFDRWKNAVNFKPYESELMVVSFEFGYAGTLDSIGKINKLFELLDWKVRKRLTEDLRYQLAAYWMAYLEMYPKRKLHQARAVRFDRDNGNYDQMILSASEIEQSFQGFLRLKQKWDEQN